jgi:hypothetical protein
VYRGSIAYLINPFININLDYRDRERTFQETSQAKTLDPFQPSEQLATVESEKMFIPSAMITVYDVIKLFGGYGYGIDQFKRRNLSGGISLANDKFTISYLVAKPYLADSKLQHAMSFGIDIAM